MTMRNLVETYNKADETDKAEGRWAYRRYQAVMLELSEVHGFPLHRVVAAFVALSPNSDYFGNLRSLVSVLIGVKRNIDTESITVSTYKHCRNRAVAYLKGEADFLGVTKGLKTRAFYNNILRPDTSEDVTVDGHMFYVWAGTNGTVKGLRMTPKIYVEIERDVQALARALGIVPNQLQATLWFTRKRLQRIKYDAQMSLFGSGTDLWNTKVDIETLRPY